MAIYAELPAIGPYQTTIRGTTTTLSAPNDTLCDGSEATHIDVSRYLTETDLLLNRLIANLGPGGASPPGFDPDGPARAYARFQGDEAIAGVRMVTFGSGSESSLDPTRPVLQSAKGLLYPMDDQGINQVNNVINGFGTSLLVDVEEDRENPASVCRISEAWIVVVVHGQAIPVQQYPGGAVGTVGGAVQQYPPSQFSTDGRRPGRTM